MITRRDALRLVATIPAVVPALSMSPMVAAAMLDRPLTAPPATDDAHLDNLYDPVTFAEVVDGRSRCDSTTHLAPQALADLEEALHKLYKAVNDPDITRLIDKLSDTAFTYGTMMAWGGLRAGAAYENLRLAILTPTMTCPDCNASYGQSRETCTRCGGRGVVATPGVIAR